MNTTDTKGAQGWNFDTTYRSLPKLFYTSQLPDPVAVPNLLVGNRALAEELGLDESIFSDEDTINSFAGNGTLPGSEPLAQAYAGHQFGHFNMLGDGRATLLGEHLTPQGTRVDVQLKGSGQTPYSRRGDGRAAVGPMLREYIISEAMHHLGIPTTRSLAVVSTGETVYREYPQRGAVLTRIAASHIRVGTFQFAAYRGSTEDLRTLADYTIARHFPELVGTENPYQMFLQEVVTRQAKLLAKWQLVGFIHGVMNTDNMALCGETIDYGPCAFMDSYNPATVFSSIDSNGRYAYQNQPDMALWNLTRFAETLLPLFHPDQAKAIPLAETILDTFRSTFTRAYDAGMRKKIGLFNQEEGDTELIGDLLDIMNTTESDYTNTFRNLASNKAPEFAEWNSRWIERLSRQENFQQEVIDLMNTHNPVIIARNHQVERALSLAARNDDLSLVNRLVEALQSPYDFCAKFADLYESPSTKNEHYRTFCGT